MVIQKNEKIVFFGDSLSCRSGMRNAAKIARKYSLDYCGSYVDILLKKILVRYPELDVEAYNKGIGGNTVVDLLSRVEEDVLRLEPDWVILFIGQNDANKGFSAEEYRANLTRLLDIFRNRNIKVLQLSTTPAPSQEKVKENLLLDEYDRIIGELSTQYQNIYVDVKKQCKHIAEYNTGEVPAVNLYNEGCHFSELGNILVAELVLDAMM